MTTNTLSDCINDNKALHMSFDHGKLRSRIKNCAKANYREIEKGCGYARSCVWTSKLSLVKEKPLQQMVRSELSHQQ